MNLKQQFSAILFFIVSLTSFSQVGIGITDPKAALDVVSTDTGFIMPRVADHTTLTVGADQTGMQVYNTTTKSIWYYDGTDWESISGTTPKAIPLWKSPTNAGDYTINAIINHAGTLYKNLTGTNTDTTPDADATNWETFVDISQFENMPLWKTTRGFYANITAGPTTQPIPGFSSTEFNSWDASNPSEDEGFSSGTSYTLSNYGGINGLNMTIMANFDHEFGTGGTNSFVFKNTGAATSNAKITISFNGGVEMFADLRSGRAINISASSISNPLAGTINTTEITDGTPGETFTSFTLQIDENLDTNRYWELFSLWNKLQFTNFGAAPPQNLNAPPYAYCCSIYQWDRLLLSNHQPE